MRGRGGMEKTRERSRAFGLWIAAVAIGLPQAAQAAFVYTDPGTGALLWQAALAAVAGLSFYFRRFLKWLRRRDDDKRN